MDTHYWELNPDIDIERAWSMPHKWTFQIKPIYDFVYSAIAPCARVLVPYAGFTRFPQSHGQTIIYIDTESNLPLPYVQDDVVHVMETLRDEDASFDIVVLDPPYSSHQSVHTYHGAKRIDISYVKDLARDLRARAVITCGYNSNGMGKTRGYTKEKMLVVAMGGEHNDYIVVLEKRT